MGKEESKRPVKESEEEDLHLQDAKETKKERKGEGSQGEVLTKIKVEKTETRKKENEDATFIWVVLMEKMLKALKKKSSDKDPKKAMIDLEVHLEKVKERATEWQGLVKEKITNMDKSNVTRVGEDTGKIDITKKRSKRNDQTSSCQYCCYHH